MPELLSPAGNFEKLKAALLYGADAVYLAGQRFGMRSQAGNFSVEEIFEAVALAHSMGKRVYLTRIEADATDPDTFFPNLDKLPGWEAESISEPMVENGLTYRFIDYVNTKL